LIRFTVGSFPLVYLVVLQGCMFGNIAILGVESLFGESTDVRLRIRQIQEQRTRTTDMVNSSSESSPNSSYAGVGGNVEEEEEEHED
jgi:hypothetical protein